MPPRSSTDRAEHEHSMGWDSSTGDMKKLDTPATHAVPLARTVRFAPTAKVRQVTKMTKEQAKDIWFVLDDFAKMKKSFAPTVQRMMNGTLPSDSSDDTEEHCTRGLEYRTKDGARRRMKNKFNGMAAVLHEQDRQIFEEVQEPERLAQIYQQVNHKCTQEAVALGAQDELDVQEYLLAAEAAATTEQSQARSEQPLDTSERSISSRGRSVKRRGKLSSTGSFHERTLRGIRRVLSGKKSRHPSQAEI